MTDRLDLPDRYRRQIEELLVEHIPEAEVWAYGSRVKGSNRAASDLDLVLRGPNLEQIPIGPLADLEEAFEKSNIPILIQTHDWARLPTSFHEEIERQYFVLQGPRTHLRARRSEQQAKRTARDKVMATEWVEGRWGDLATLEYGRSLRGYKEQSGGYRVYGTNGPIGKHDTFLVKHPTVIIGRKGAYRGVHYSPDPCFVIDTAFYLKPTANIDIRWAYYQLLTQDINGMDSGSAIPSTSRPEFYQLPVKIPPLSEQRAIARILGVLDDRIELNRRMSDTIEEIARALFRSWFVSFDSVSAKSKGHPSGLPPDLDALFPAVLEESELGHIPSGWSIGTLGDIAQEVRESIRPEDIEPQTAYIALEHMPRNSLSLSEWTTADHVASSKLIFRSGEILFGRLRPYFHKVGVAPADGVCSTDIIVASPISPAWFGFVLGHMSSAKFVDHASAATTGTRMPRTNWTTMSSYEIAIPPLEIAEAYARLVRPHIDQIRLRIHESLCLSKIRDAILPRLLSERADTLFSEIGR